MRDLHKSWIVATPILIVQSFTVVLIFIAAAQVAGDAVPSLHGPLEVYNVQLGLTGAEFTVELLAVVKVIAARAHLPLLFLLVASGL